MTLTAKLTGIVLALDACIIPFIGLTAWGLGRLDPWPAFGGAAVAFVLVLLIAVLVMRRPRMLWLGWLVQLGLIATGLLLGAMYVLGAGSLLLWVWCLWRGAKADQPVQEEHS